MICFKCGTMNEPGVNYCTNCNFLLPKLDIISDSGYGGINVFVEEGKHISNSGTNECEVARQLRRAYEKISNSEITKELLDQGLNVIKEHIYLRIGEINYNGLNEDDLRQKDAKIMLITLQESYEMFIEAITEFSKYLTSDNPENLVEAMKISDHANRVMLEARDLAVNLGIGR